VGESVILSSLHILSFGVFLPACSLLAIEQAEIPYIALDQVWVTASHVNPTNLTFRAIIVSTNPAVKSADIQMTIRSKLRGDIPVELSTNGELKVFTHTKELAKENPPVTSNQPKGSLSLQMWFIIPLPEGLSFPYSTLRNGVEEFNKCQVSVLSPLAAASGVIFNFPHTSGGKARVEIRSPTRTNEFTADPQGAVSLKLESRWADNAEVKLSEPVQSLMPDIE
jgi:hypothetical protein